MVNSPKNNPKKKASWVSLKVQETQSNSAESIQKILHWISGTEEFIGNKFIGIIQSLEGEKRDEYITTITHPETMKPLVWNMLVSFQIDEKVSVSRVIAYIQACVSQG